MTVYPDVDFYTKTPKSPENSPKNFRNTPKNNNLLKTKGILNSGRWKFFFQGRANIAFTGGSQKDFCRGAKVSKFHYTHSDTKKTTFFAKILMGNGKLEYQ